MTEDLVQFLWGELSPRHRNREPGLLLSGQNRLVGLGQGIEGGDGILLRQLGEFRILQTFLIEQVQYGVDLLIGERHGHPLLSGKIIPNSLRTCNELGEKMKRIFALLLSAALLLTIAGCAPAAGTDDKTIKIAVMDTEVVFVANDSYVNGISMAIEDLNALYADQGYTISYEFYENGYMFQTGMEALNAIRSDPEITAVVGTSSLNILDVAAEVLDSAGKLLITYYSAPDSLFENGYTMVFRNCYGENDLGSAIAAYAAGRDDMRRIAIYHSDTDYERTMAQAFLRGVEGTDADVVDVATTTPLEAELEALLDRWETLGVDTVFVSQYLAEDAFNILRLVRTRNPEIHVLGDFSFDYTDYLLADRAVSNDIYIATPVPLEPGPEVDAFYERYREKYGAEPTQWAVQLYDSIRMIVDTAVSIGSTDSEDIAQALHGEQGYDGVGGTIAFDEAGRLIGRQPRIMVSEDGMFDFVEE